MFMVMLVVVVFICGCMLLFFWNIQLNSSFLLMCSVVVVGLSLKCCWFLLLCILVNVQWLLLNVCWQCLYVVMVVVVGCSEWLCELLNQQLFVLCCKGVVQCVVGRYRLLLVNRLIGQCFCFICYVWLLLVNGCICCRLMLVNQWLLLVWVVLVVSCMCCWLLLLWLFMFDCSIVLGLLVCLCRMMLIILDIVLVLQMVDVLLCISLMCLMKFSGMLFRLVSVFCFSDIIGQCGRCWLLIRNSVVCGFILFRLVVVVVFIGRYSELFLCEVVSGGWLFMLGRCCSRLNSELQLLCSILLCLIIIIGSEVCIELCGKWLLVICIGVILICVFSIGDGVGVGCCCVGIGVGVMVMWCIMNMFGVVCSMWIGNLVIRWVNVVLFFSVVFSLGVVRLVSLVVLNSSICWFCCVYCCRVGVSGLCGMWQLILVCLCVFIGGISVYDSVYDIVMMNMCYCSYCYCCCFFCMVIDVSVGGVVLVCCWCVVVQ